MFVEGRTNGSEHTVHVLKYQLQLPRALADLTLVGLKMTQHTISCHQFEFTGKEIPVDTVKSHGYQAS
jgi:hypothetical protein